MECIGCTQCIDACDDIMDRVGRPRGLVRYSSQDTLATGETRILRPRVQTLATQLDTRYGWHDETATALGLPAELPDASVSALLAAQTRGRLRELDASVLARRRSTWVWPRRLLAFLFAFVPLAPGVQGLLGERGSGHQGRGTLGADGAEDPVAVPRPMRADFWMQTFIENPLPVEALPPEGDAEEAGMSGTSITGWPIRGSGDWSRQLWDRESP